MQEKSTRVRRIAGLIQNVIAIALKKEISDPRLQHTSISGIDLAPDLGQAIIFFTMSDPSPELIASAEKAFKHANGFFRSQISSCTDLRYTPQLVFQYDAALMNAERMHRLLEDI